MKKNVSVFTFLSIITFAFICLICLFMNIDQTYPLDPNAITKNFQPININIADIQELTMLPGIGEQLASKIIEYRNKNGSFGNIIEIFNVDGVGPDLFMKIQPYISVGGTQ